MKVTADEAYKAFLQSPEDADWSGTRIKDVRDQPLQPGGRASLTLFATAPGEPGESDRSHPRLQVSMPPARDPSPPGTLFPFAAPPVGPASIDELRVQILQALAANRTVLDAADLDPSAAPAGSERYWRNSIRVQRVASFFAQVRTALDGWLGSGALPGGQRDAALRLVHRIEAETFATDLRFDDETTGTYHSFLQDKPFVHYLERLLASLPEEGTEGFAVLPAEAQYSVRRQRKQLQNHLDYLMRHKYAYHVVDETDIERTVGGLLIDRDSRRIVSEMPGSESLAPRYEILRIAPDASHAHAGAWVYRDHKGDIHLGEDGARVRVDDDLLHASPVSSERLTFLREPGSERLRPGMRLDWDGNGYIEAGPLEWVEWAGHCDIHGIIEGLGITMSDRPRLEEYRSDSDTTTVYDRDLVLEMFASVLELSSNYRYADGSGVIRQGKMSFGGSRNDSLPDRLQLQTASHAGVFRWPLRGRADALRVTSIELPDEQGTLQPADMDTVFFQHLPDLDALDFAPNPRYVGTVEGDYNMIDVSGGLLRADILVEGFDAVTGYPTKEKRSTVIDLRARPEGERFFLGTFIEDPVARRLFRVYLDRRDERIVAELDVYEQQGGQWVARTIDTEHISIPLALPPAATPRCTLSHEMRLDNPEMYQALLDIAFRKAQFVCADTDKKVQVWNGVVTRLNMYKVAENPGARVERWHVDIEARFGLASLDYLLRRSETGERVAYCPAVGEESLGNWPDFIWQEFPDIGSKSYKDGAWLVNMAMLDRHLVNVMGDSSVPGGIYVYDDHIKNLYELIYAALARYPFTIVHANKRYGFTDRAAWQDMVAKLQERRSRLSFGED